MIQLVCRFDQPTAGFDQRARDAVALLSAQPTCDQVRLARSTEDAGHWTLTAEFPSFPATAQRSAHSTFEPW